MSCYSPMVVRTKFGEPFQVPCGQCIGCRLERARQWAVRCVHEAQMHEENCFVTLTFSPENLPSDLCVRKDDVQLFMKRLRNYYKGKEIKYYACGEYGSQVGKRPHYHLCLFGVSFREDRYLFRTGKHTTGPLSSLLYRSPALEKLWPYGFSTIGEVTFESAGYVARYCMKKITGEISEAHYNGRTPEFALMSRRPGIGSSWFEKYSSDVYPKDFFTINGSRVKPGRYYDSLLQKKNPKLYVKIKERREQNAVEENSKRLYEKKVHRTLITKNLNRSLDNDDF